jgi:hypothetical protein
MMHKALTSGRVLRGLPLEGLATAYRAGDLHRRSELELFEAAVDVLSVPKKDVSSFSLHAPLELLARYCLLPHVHPSRRELARMQLVATAVYYEAQGGESTPTVGPPSGSLEDARHGLIESVRAGELDLAQASAAHLAAHLGADDLRKQFCDFFLTQLSCSAHSHIFLHLVSRVGVGLGALAARMLPGFARELARDSQHRVQWALDEAAITAPRTARTGTRLEQALARVEPVGQPAAQGLYAIIQQAERLELPRRYLSGVLPGPEAGLEQVHEHFAMACRIAARSMLQDSSEHARYGWTHCLTLPQAAWALSSSLQRVDVAMRIASTHVLGLRAAIGSDVLSEPFDPPPPGMSLATALRESPERAAAAAWHVPPEALLESFGALATEASIRNDCHLVKYTLACLDAAMSDAAHARLYLAGAAFLAALWMREQPEPTLEARLHERE